MVQSAGAENMRGAEKVHVPPIKTQGIKTKLVPWIARCAAVDVDTVWVEPFMGSEVVGFNLAPKRALFSDTNVHIIDFYRSIQDGELTAAGCRKFLESEGARLKSRVGITTMRSGTGSTNRITRMIFSSSTGLASMGL